MKQVIAKINLGSLFDIGSAEPNKINPKLPEVNTLPIATIPSTKGNTTNLNTFVTDPNGDRWFIDYAGDTINLSTQATTMLRTTSNQVNNTITMVAIPQLTMTLTLGWYRVEFTPYYGVNATTNGTGWNFGAGTAVIAHYAYRSLLPSTATANAINNYVSRTQNFATKATSTLNGNRGTIIVEFQCTTPGTLIPMFRAEVAAANAVTLLAGSKLILKKEA